MNMRVYRTLKFVVIMALLLAPSGMSQTLDQYGGSTVIPCAATGFFHTQKIGNRWWLCTPAGHVFNMFSIYYVLGTDPVDERGVPYATRLATKYATGVYGSNRNANEAANELTRMKQWGFNTTGNGSDPITLPYTTSPGWPGDGTQPVKMPFERHAQNPGVTCTLNGSVTNIYLPLNIGTANSNNGEFPDVFRPAWTTCANSLYATDPDIPNYRASPYFLGLFSEDTDFLNGFSAAAGPNPDGRFPFATDPPVKYSEHNGAIVLVSAPNIAYNNDITPIGVNSDTKNYAKYAFRDYLKSLPQYQTGGVGDIAKLNAAWGSNYTTWDSTGTQVVGESVGTGNGSQTVFNRTLSNTNIVPWNVVVKVAGVAKGADCQSPSANCQPFPGPGAGKGGIDSPNFTSASNITYATGVLTLTFTSAPASGAAITVDYIHDGWSYGTGFLDEDARSSHSWIGSDIPFFQTGMNATTKVDVDNFLQQISEKYFSVARAAIKAVAPNNLFLGSTSLGGWRTPPPCPVLRGAAKYVDMISVSTDASNAQIDWILGCTGDVPIAIYESLTSNQDSGRWRQTPELGATWNLANQNLRGQYYLNDIANLSTHLAAATNSIPFVGLTYWVWTDDPGGGRNFGIVTLGDNAHNGVEDCVATGTDAQGYPTGGEELIPSWQPSTAYILTNGPFQLNLDKPRVQASVAGTIYYFTTTVAGTSGTTTPNWPTALGATVVDGGVTWQNTGVKPLATCFGDFASSAKIANTLWLTDFSVAVTPASRIISPGQQTTYTFSVTPLIGTPGVVTFSASNLPTGASVSFNPTSVTGSGSTTATISSTSGTPPGNYIITFAGTGSPAGAPIHSANATLIVSGLGGCDGLGNCFIRAAATGSANGSNWTNACTGFTGTCAPASLIRGATYWIAGGSYADVVFNTPASGTLIIVVRAATVSNHGPATDWQSSFAGQALFSNAGSSITTSNWFFDGQSRGPDWQSGYNLKFQNTTQQSGQALLIGASPGNGASNITLQYVEIQGANTTVGGTATWFDEGIACNGLSNNIYIGYSYLHDVGDSQVKCNEGSLGKVGNSYTFEFDYFLRNHTGDTGLTNKSQALSITASNLLVRYSIFQDINSNGVIVDPSATAQVFSNWDIYGNLVFYDPTYSGNSNVALKDGFVALLGETLRGYLHIYNNTIGGIKTCGAGTCSGRFLFLQGAGTNLGGPSVGIYNNLTWNTDNADTASGGYITTLDYNSYYAGTTGVLDTSPNAKILATNPFVSSTPISKEGFELLAGTDAGLSLGSSPYNTDLKGLIRGTGVGGLPFPTVSFVPTASITPTPPSDSATAGSVGYVSGGAGGRWDRGAYQYPL